MILRKVDWEIRVHRPGLPGRARAEVVLFFVFDLVFAI